MKTLSVHQNIAVPASSNHPIHSPRLQKAVVNREAKALGHFQSVIRMSQENKDSGQILVQLKAVENELAAIRKEIIKDQSAYYLLEAKKKGDSASIDALNELVKSLLK